jgi:hypothetical protein
MFWWANGCINFISKMICNASFTTKPLYMYIMLHGVLLHLTSLLSSTAWIVVPPPPPPTTNCKWCSIPESDIYIKYYLCKCMLGESIVYSRLNKTLIFHHLSWFSSISLISIMAAIQLFRLHFHNSLTF